MTCFSAQKNRSKLWPVFSIQKQVKIMGGESLGPRIPWAQMTNQTVGPKHLLVWAHAQSVGPIWP